MNKLHFLDAHLNHLVLGVLRLNKALATRKLVEYTWGFKSCYVGFWARFFSGSRCFK